MREALALVTDQGLESMWAQHKTCHDQLWKGLTELGLEPYGASLSHPGPAARVACTSFRPALQTSTNVRLTGELTDDVHLQLVVASEMITVPVWRRAIICNK